MGLSQIANKKFFLLLILFFETILFFSYTRKINAQDTLRLTCLFEYDKEVDDFSTCNDPEYCSSEGYTFDRDDCNVDISECKSLICNSDTGTKYCCNRSKEEEEEEEGGGIDTPYGHTVECDDKERQTSFNSNKYKSVTDAISGENCIELDDPALYLNSRYCDLLHKCIVDASTSDPLYLCCDYIPPDNVVGATNSFKGCTNVDSVKEQEQCWDCVGTAKNPTGAIWTELGCIDPSPAGLITRIFQIALGVMGGIAVIRFIQIALVYQSNNPEKIAEGPQMLTSLAGGLILLILGVIVLRFLGINVLGLPEGFLG